MWMRMRHVACGMWHLYGIEYSNSHVGGVGGGSAVGGELVI